MKRPPFLTKQDNNLLTIKVTIENHLEHAYARQIGVLDEQSIEHDSSLLKDFRQNILTESEILAREGVSL